MSQLDLHSFYTSFIIDMIPDGFTYKADLYLFFIKETFTKGKRLPEVAAMFKEWLWRNNLKSRVDYAFGTNNMMLGGEKAPIDLYFLREEDLLAFKLSFEI